MLNSEKPWVTNEERCPHCNADLQGKEIPKHYLEHKPDCEDPDKCFCLPYGKVTHFSRKIGVEIRGVYDGVLYWRCPECDGEWHRFEDDAMIKKAIKHMKRV